MAVYLIGQLIVGHFSLSEGVVVVEAHSDDVGLQFLKAQSHVEQSGLILHIQRHLMLFVLFVVESATDDILLLAFEQLFLNFIYIFLTLSDGFELLPALLCHWLCFEVEDLLDFAEILQLHFDSELVAALVRIQRCLDDIWLRLI